MTEDRKIRPGDVVSVSVGIVSGVGMVFAMSHNCTFLGQVEIPDDKPPVCRRRVNGALVEDGTPPAEVVEAMRAVLQQGLARLEQINEGGHA